MQGFHLEAAFDPLLPLASVRFGEAHFSANDSGRVAMRSDHGVVLRFSQSSCTGLGMTVPQLSRQGEPLNDPVGLERRWRCD